jgi:glycosyltransferase involved in cell wall biosynthesis
MPKVSIILPTYNGAKWIAEAIQSLIYQTFVDWELLVIDDGSKDDTGNIVQDFAKKDSRVFYIKNKQNIGLQKTLNKGINLSRGKYIARLDDDDTWTDKLKLENQVNFLEENKDHVLVGTGVIVVDERGNEILRYLNPKTDSAIRAVFLRRNPFVHSSVVFRKESVVSVGMYSEDGDSLHVEDYDLWLKLGRIGKVYNLPTYSVKFMSRKGSITQNNRIHQFKKNLELVKLNKQFYPNYFSSILFGYIRFFMFRVCRILPENFRNKIFKIYKNI